MYSPGALVTATDARTPTPKPLTAGRAGASGSTPVKDTDPATTAPGADRRRSTPCEPTGGATSPHSSVRTPPGLLAAPSRSIERPANCTEATVGAGPTF